MSFADFINGLVDAVVDRVEEAAPAAERVASAAVGAGRHAAGELTTAHRRSEGQPTTAREARTAVHRGRAGAPPSRSAPKPKPTRAVSSKGRDFMKNPAQARVAPNRIMTNKDVWEPPLRINDSGMHGLPRGQRGLTYIVGDNKADLAYWDGEELQRVEDRYRLGNMARTNPKSEAFLDPIVLGESPLNMLAWMERFGR